MSEINARLKSFIERIERLEEEKAGIAADIRDVYAEAKGTGFDVKIMRQVIRLRKMESADREEQQTLLDLYMNALGMLVGTPLGEAALDRSISRQMTAASIPAAAVAILARDSVSITDTTNFDPATGEIIETTPTPPESRTGQPSVSGSTQSCGSPDGSAARSDRTLAGMAAPSPAAETSSHQGTPDRAESYGAFAIASQPIVEAGSQDTQLKMTEAGHVVNPSSPDPVISSIEGKYQGGETKTSASESTRPALSKAPGTDHKTVNLADVENTPAFLRRDPDAAHWAKAGGNA